MRHVRSIPMRCSYPSLYGVRAQAHKEGTPDMLQMSGKGYDIWRDAVRPVLVEAERAYE